MEDYERQILSKLAGKINALIDKEFKKEELDRSFFEFKFSVSILNQTWEKMEELTLFDDHQGFCGFCQTRTSYYDSKRQLHLCPSCYTKLAREEK